MTRLLPSVSAAELTLSTEMTGVVPLAVRPVRLVTFILTGVPSPVAALVTVPMLPPLAVRLAE